MKRSYKITILITIAAGLLAGCGGQGGPGEDSDTLGRTQAIERGLIEVEVSGTGTIEADAQSSLSFQTTGNVGTVHVEVGDRVQAGDTLMELDPTTTDVSLASAQVELIQAEDQLEELLDAENHAVTLAEARKSLAQAEDELDDAEYLRRVRQKGNRASQLDIDAAEAKLLLAEEELDRAKERYDSHSGRDEDNPTRAVALRNYANARQDRDAAERALNWLTGSPTEIEQAQLDADVAVAQANVAQARDRVEILKGGPDPDEVAAAEARVEAARAQVEQANLTAPFDGTILAVNYRVGDRVSLGESALVIADLAPLHVETTIDELDIAQVEVGQEAILTLDALPEVSLQGRVASIDLVPPATGGTTEYPVVVDLTEVDERARVGMTAAVDILVSRKESVLLIPNWALRFDGESGQVYAIAITENGTERRPLELGLRNDTMSQVISGLGAGDVVGAAGSEEDSEGFRGPFGGGG